MKDLSIGLLREGYRAIALDRRQRGGGPSYASRLMGRRALVLAGRAGAQLFYDEDVVERSGAVPPPLARLLFGRGAVHGLDGEEHLTRKKMFLDTLGPGQVAPCAATVGAELERAVGEWSGREVDLHAQLVLLYGMAVLDWAGIECSSEEAIHLSRRYADIVDGFGFAGPAYVRGWIGRRRTDGWARTLVTDLRRGRVASRPGSALEVVATSDLDEDTAAVELGNVLRPTIAVSWLGAFAAWQLDRAPRSRAPLADPANVRERVAFSQEVRRTSPFVPALVGKVHARSTHQGLDLRPGDFVVLDVRGINLDAELHPDPMLFRPDRFLDKDPGPFDLVPQGGGFPEGHRCPGESLALQLLAETVRVPAGTEYDVVSRPEVDVRRMPTLPEGGPRIRVAGSFPTGSSRMAPFRRGT